MCSHIDIDIEPTASHIKRAKAASHRSLDAKRRRSVSPTRLHLDRSIFIITAEALLCARHPVEQRTNHRRLPSRSRPGAPRRQWTQCCSSSSSSSSEGRYQSGEALPAVEHSACDQDRDFGFCPSGPHTNPTRATTPPRQTLAQVDATRERISSGLKGLDQSRLPSSRTSPLSWRRRSSSTPR